MHSESLKAQHPEIYKKFFNEYDLVISSPIIFSYFMIGTSFLHKQTCFWAQKIPLRNYIGISLDQGNNHLPFIQKKNANETFEENEINDFYPITRKLLTAMGIPHKVGFLSEYNRLDSPSMMANIIIAKMLIEGKISQEDIRNLNTEGHYEDVLKKTIDTDMEMYKEKDFFAGRRNASHLMTQSMIGSPSHFLTTCIGGKTEIHKSDLDYNELDLTCIIIDPGLFYKAFFQEDVFSEKEKKVEDIKKKFGMNIRFAEATEEMNNYYSIETYNSLMELYTNKKHNTDFFNKIQVLDKLPLIVHGNYNNYLDCEKIKHILKKHIISKDIEISVAQVGGNRIGIFGNRQLQISDKIISQIAAEMGLPLSKDYDSHKDGFEKEGTKIEQWKSQRIFSEFSSQYIVTSITGDKQEIIATEYDEFMKKKCTGLLLDAIDNKIYLNGEKIKSSILCSHVGTIEILKIAIKNFKKEIHNKQLPISSYSKNKNEMLGKILLPLMKIAEKETKQRLDLICKGSIYDFFIKLNPSDIKISIIEKLVS